MSAETDLKEIETWVKDAGEHSTRALRDLLSKLRHKFGFETTTIDEPGEDDDEVDEDDIEDAEDVAPVRRGRPAKS